MLFHTILPQTGINEPLTAVAASHFLPLSDGLCLKGLVLVVSRIIDLNAYALTTKTIHKRDKTIICCVIALSAFVIAMSWNATVLRHGLTACIQSLNRTKLNIGSN